MDHRAETARTLHMTHGFGYKRLATILGTTPVRTKNWLRIFKPRAPYRPHKCQSCGQDCTGTTCESCIAVRHFNFRQSIEQSYLQGHPLQAIADGLGISREYVGKEVSTMRREGWPLPYRYLGYAVS